MKTTSVPVKYAGGVNKYVRDQGRRDVLRVVYELFGLDAAAVCERAVNQRPRLEPRARVAV